MGQISVDPLLGVLLTRLKFPTPPILLGFILGPMLEEYLRRSMLLYDGDLSVFFTRPLSATFMGITFTLLILPVAGALMKAVRRRNRPA